MSPLSINPPEAGSLVALADDLYWMRFTLPFRLNHINLYAFDTKDGWLLLDCGILLLYSACLLYCDRLL